MTFIDLNKTYGMVSVPPIYEVPIYHLVVANYGLQDLTALSLHNFQNLLDSDSELTLNYLTSKAGYNPNDKTEFDSAMNMYVDGVSLLTDTFETYMFICQMHMSSSLDELNSCISSNSKKNLFL